jgi:hypothetical protein
MESRCPEHLNFPNWGLGFSRASCGIAGVNKFRIATRHAALFKAAELDADNETIRTSKTMVAAFAKEG